MEVSGEVYSPVALFSLKELFGPAVWSKAGLDTAEKRKITSLSGIET
jgi:hypothetical protein